MQFQQLFERLKIAGDLSSKGIDELEQDLRVNSSHAGVVKRLLEMGVNTERLAEAISVVFDLPLFPFDRRPSQLGPDAPRPALPKVVSHGDDDQHLMCENGAIYLVNPFDRAALKQATARYGQSTVRVSGVISRQAFALQVGERIVEQMPAADSVTPYSRKLDALLMLAVRQNASDIHLEPQINDTRVRLRVDNVLREVDRYSHEEYLQISNIIQNRCTSATAGSYQEAMDEMFVFEVPPNRKIKMRVMMIPGTVAGQKNLLPVFCLRLLGNNLEQRGLAELGIPDTKHNPQLTSLRLLCERKNGLVLVSGPTGSGKTTTLSAVMGELQKIHPDRCSYTIEDPVEMNLVGVNHIQVNEKSGVTFERGVKSFLRGDPDVILIGEIRDLPVAKVALTASITGHLVFSTIHTNSAIEGVSRLIDVGCDAYIVASALKAVTAQRLVRKVCPKCCERVRWGELIDGSHPSLQDPENELMRLRYSHADRMYKSLKDYPKTNDHEVAIAGVGCSACGNSGYKGRMLVTELFQVTPRVADLIAQRASIFKLRDQALQDGFLEMWEHGASLIFKQRTTTMDEMINALGERESSQSVGTTNPVGPEADRVAPEGADVGAPLT